MNSRQRFLATCRGEEVDRPPIWLMRQAGRYLPEYRRLREQYSFWEMLRRPELAMEATLQPLRRFRLDAAIVFSDILIVPAAMGLSVDYTADGPRLQPLLSRPEQLDTLRHVDAGRDFAYLATCLRRLAAELHPHTALIGFAGAPFTLAAYLVEERPTEGPQGIVQLAHREPQFFRHLLERLTEVVSELLLLQAESGADALQIFDTWAGRLDEKDYRQLAAPWTRRVVETVRSTGLPLILYLRESHRLLEAAAESGCQVLSLDDSLSLADARRRLGPRPVLQGNLAPETLFLPPEEIDRRAAELLEQVGGRGLIVNLARGVLPNTPLEGVAALVEAVGRWSA